LVARRDSIFGALAREGGAMQSPLGSRISSEEALIQQERSRLGKAGEEKEANEDEREDALM